jgi:O-antigen ligase
MLLLVDKGSLLKRVVLVSLMIIILIGLYFSYTRAAWLSVFGAGLILIVVLSKVKFAYVFGALSLLIIFLLGNVDVIQMELARNKEEHTTEDFNKRLQSATNVTTDASNLERINRWTCAIEMAKERPFFGFGPGTYAFEYARFQDPENLTIISTNFGDLGNAHSEYLSALSETGIIGLVLFVAFIGSYFYYLIRIVQEARHQNQAIYIIACGILFSQTTYFIHAVLNNFLDTDKAAFPIYSMMAITFVLKQFLSTKPQGGVERSGIYPADSVNFEM